MWLDSLAGRLSWADTRVAVWLKMQWETAGRGTAEGDVTKSESVRRKMEREQWEREKERWQMRGTMGTATDGGADVAEWSEWWNRASQPQLCVNTVHPARTGSMCVERIVKIAVNI